MNKEYFYLYKITNKIDGKIYVGVHRTHDLQDGYMGSGLYIKRAIAFHGVKNFKKDILEFFDSVDEMFDKESMIVNENFLKRKDTYNVCLGGTGGNVHIALAAFRKKLDEDEVFRQSVYESIRLGLERKRLTGWVNPGFLGREHSEETKQKMREKALVHSSGEKNSQFGTMWITNGKESKKIKKGAPLPAEWKKGRVIKNCEHSQKTSIIGVGVEDD